MSFVLNGFQQNSRPNAPVNVIVGALILKELMGLTDDEVMEECEFDFSFFLFPDRPGAFRP